jgi:hypothetical protein
MIARTQVGPKEVRVAATVMMRMRADTHKALREIAAEDSVSLQDALARAVDLYRKTRFFEQMDAAVEALRADPAAWKDYQDERSHWDTTLTDGIEPVAEQASTTVRS